MDMTRKHDRPAGPAAFDARTGLYTAGVLPGAPTRLDDKAAEDRRKRGRDGKRIAVPEAPPVATRESVAAEIWADKTARRLPAYAGVGAFNARTGQTDKPAGVQEHALQDQQPQYSQRQAPALSLAPTYCASGRHLWARWQGRCCKAR